MSLQSELRIADKDNPNLVWVHSAEGGKMVIKTEETTQTSTQCVTPGETADEEVITTTVVTSVRVKKINTIHNTVNQ